MTTWQTSVRAKHFCMQLTQTGALFRVWVQARNTALWSWNRTPQVLVWLFSPSKLFIRPESFSWTNSGCFWLQMSSESTSKKSPLKWTLLLASGNLILAPFQKWLRKQLEKNHIQLVGGDGVAEKANNTSARQQWYALCAFPDVRNHTTQRTASPCTPRQTLFGGLGNSWTATCSYSLHMQLGSFDVCIGNCNIKFMKWTCLDV